MKRMLIVSGAVAAILVALAPAALAKGAGQVVISGPGLRRPLVIRGAPDQSGPGAFWEFVSNIGIFQGTKQAAPSQGTLGARYRMVVYIARTESGKFDPRRADHFIVLAYPYAVPTPWFFVPSNNRAGELVSVSGGWYMGADAARLILISRGLPKTSRVPVVAPAVAPQTTIQAVPAPSRHLVPASSSAASTLWIAVGLAMLLAVLVVAGALAGRPREAGTAA